MIIRSLFARLAFMADTRKLKDFNLGLKRVKQSMIGLAAMWGVGTIALGGFIREAAKLEQIKVAFKTMLGSAGLAKETLAELFEFARVTPFEIPGVLGTARILLGMGSAAKELRPQLKMIGDIAAGLSVPLEQIAMSFGKVQAAGYLTGYELQNLRRAGVPLVRELSAILGKDREAVQHMVRTRKVSFDLFQQAFKNMTEAGGVFHNLMFEQAKTLLGIISNIKDAIRITAMEAGEILLPTVKKFTQGILLWLEANKKIIRLRIGNFLKILGKHLAQIAGFMFEVVRGFYLFAEAIGGVERVLKILLVTMTGLIMLGFASAIGHITIGLYKLAAAAIAGQVAFSAWPIVIGLAFGFLYLAIDDLYRYLTGWKGKTIAGWLDKEFLGGNIKLSFDALGLMFDSLKLKIKEHSEILNALWDMWSGIATLNFGRFKRGFNELLNMGKEDLKKFKPGDILSPLGDAVRSMDYSQEIMGAAKYLGEKAMGPLADWKKEIPKMKETASNVFHAPSNLISRVEAGAKRQMVTEPAQKWKQMLSPVTVTINQTLNNVTEEDAKAIATMTGQELYQIKGFKRDQN